MRRVLNSVRTRYLRQKRLRFSSKPNMQPMSCFGVLLLVLVSQAKAKEADTLWLDVAKASVTNNELLSHASVLADDLLEGREAGSRGGREAAKYIIRVIKEADLQPAGDGASYFQLFSGNSRNLLAKLPGNDPLIGEEFIVIGAHYDHVGYGNRTNSYGPWGRIHNGADDNASGVAALLEVIDALKHSGYQPRRTILFAFWDGEEKGLLGSKHWMKSPTMPFNNLQLAVNVDMVGRLTEGRIEIGGTRSGYGLRQMMSSRRLTEGTWLDFTWDYKENSDHWTFYQAGIPSMYVHTGVHNDYHRPSDDVEKLNIEGIRTVSQFLIEQVCELADAETLPEFRSKSRLDNPTAQKRQEKPLPQIASRLGFSWKWRAGEVRVTGVRNSTTRAAGLKWGDRIVAVEDQTCDSESLLPNLALHAETELKLAIMRNGLSEPIQITLPLLGEPTRIGMSWRADDAEPSAVYVTRVVPYSPADLAGIELHDRIYAMDGVPTSGQQNLLERVEQRIAEGAEEFLLEVETRGVVRDVLVPLSPQKADAADISI